MILLLEEVAADRAISPPQMLHEVVEQGRTVLVRADCWPIRWGKKGAERFTPLNREPERCNGFVALPSGEIKRMADRGGHGIQIASVRNSDGEVGQIVLCRYHVALKKMFPEGWLRLGHDDGLSNLPTIALHDLWVEVIDAEEMSDGHANGAS